MKIALPLAFIFFTNTSFSQVKESPNIFIITTDGFRWQEIFNGADSLIINDPGYVNDTGLLKQMFWDDDPGARRKKLMPFTWQTIEKQGALYGNGNFENWVSVANPYRFSYAGYNEILTGYADPSVIRNRKRNNKNENLLDFLNRQPAYENKVAAFTSWNLFEYILNKKQSDIHLNTGYELLRNDSLSATGILINAVQQYAVDNRQNTRNDMLTFVTAKEYIKNKHPKIVYLGFGETDESAHSGKYDDYLQHAHLFDEFLSQLWYLVNSDPFYKNNTSFIITTDHGRGSYRSNWSNHGSFTNGSNNTWLMTIGNLFEAKGMVKKKQEIFSEQLAQTIIQLLGFEFTPSHPVADALSLSEINAKQNPRLR
jgi:hypothetical protein